MSQVRYLKESSTGWRLSVARIERMELFVAEVAAGGAIMDGCRAAGVGRSTYHRWRARYPEFRALIDTFRTDSAYGRKDLPAGIYDGTFRSGRKVFFGFDTFWHQAEIDHAIGKAQPGEVVLILVAPETGKTTYLEDKIAIELGETPNLRITYVTESLMRTRKICGRLQRRMTNPADFPVYLETFGPFYSPGQERQGKPWAADFFTVFKADHDERDYSFEGRGWRSAVAGTRTDKMYLDDIQSLRSLNQTPDIIDRLRQDFFSRPGREGVIVVTGTRVGIGDVYEEMWEQGIVKERNIVRLPIMDGEGRSLCPELWPEDALARKRELVGEDAWWRNYMQKPRHSMDAAFTDAMIEGALDELRPLGSSVLVDRVATLDPALAGGNALAVFGYDTERLELIDFDYRFNVARVEDIVAVIERAHVQYGFADLVIETNAYQRGLIHDTRLAEVARRGGFRIHGHETHMNKIDGDLSVARMPSAFIRGEIRWPGTPESAEKMRPFIDQHLGWRANIPTKRRTQDLVMVQWFAWLFWERRRKTMGNVTPFTRIHRPAPFRVRSAPLTTRGVHGVG